MIYWFFGRCTDMWKGKVSKYFREIHQKSPKKLDRVNNTEWYSMFMFNYFKYNLYNSTLLWNLCFKSHSNGLVVWCLKSLMSFQLIYKSLSMWFTPRVAQLQKSALLTLYWIIPVSTESIVRETKCLNMHPNSPITG